MTGNDQVLGRQRCFTECEWGPCCSVTDRCDNGIDDDCDDLVDDADPECQVIAF